MEETVAGEKVRDLPIVIRRFKDAKDVKGCHILFISDKENDNVKDILGSLDKNVLTVSDMDGFARKGGMIRFVTSNNKIKLQVNLRAVKTADLNISSKLLRLAEIINP